MRWLITGCSSGFGLSLARAVLAHPEEKVIATSRNPSSSPDAIKEITSHANAVWESLDVASADLEAQLSTIVAKHGPIDVLINNAGYAVGGVFKTIPTDFIRQQYDTNFFGAIRLMQSVIPAMRESGRGGVIVNISSAEFWDPHPGATVYASSKWALEGLSESLAPELASFNVRVLIAEPGGMRTSFIDPAKVSKGMIPVPDAYKGTIADYVLQTIVSTHGTQSLDPEKGARAVIQEVFEPTVIKGADGKETGHLLRLPLGKESCDAMHEKIKRMAGEREFVREAAFKCEFDA